MSESRSTIRVRRWIRLLAPPLIAVAALLLAACSESGDPPSAQRQTAQPVAAEPQAAEQDDYQQQVERQPAEQVEYQQQAFQQEQAMQEQSEVTAPEALAEEADEQSQPMTQAEEEAQEETYEQSASDSSARPLPATTYFEDYPTIGWRETADDDTSTFSLDVDRTSYFLALNWVDAGYRIEPASVRAEEWINAFNYGYESPRVTDSFAVTTDIVEHPLHNDLHLVRIAAQAPEFVDNTPLNVTLVLDASGSMQEGNRVAIAREAAESIRRGLRNDDRIAVVLFSDNVVDYERHRVPNDPAIERIIESLSPGGSTNVQAGLNHGVKLADEVRRERPDAYNYVILMSDGVANVDATDPFAILRSAADRDESNPLRLITVGVGIANYNDVLLEQLAQYGNGWYRYLSDTGQARSTFSRDNWLALSIPFADQARAQVRWDDGVVAAGRLVGYENRVTSDRSFEEDRKEFAEIPAGSAITAFFEVELTSDALRSDVVDLGEIELRWLRPMSDESVRQQVEMVSPIAAFGDDDMRDLGSIVALTADR